MGRRGCILGLLQLGDAVSAQPLVLLLLAAPPLPLLLQLRLHCLHRLPALRRHLLQLWRERERENERQREREREDERDREREMEREEGREGEREGGGIGRERGRERG